MSDVRGGLAYSLSTLVRLTHLRWRRLEKGLTQEDLAQLSGINRKTLSFLERGIREPRPANIVRLAAALECEPRDLMEPET